VFESLELGEGEGMSLSSPAPLVLGPLAGRGLSSAMSALVAAVDAVLAQVPAELPGPQALADAAALLRQVERLRAGALDRVADVDHRELHVLDGAPSTATWVEAQQTSLDRGEVALARRMGSLPRLQEAVRDGLLPIATAERVGTALSGLRRHLDRPDGLIDGQDGEQALLGVIGHGVRQMVCQALGGLADDDPRLNALLADCAEILTWPTSQLARLEAAFVLLARQVEPAQLPGALAQLVDALLPDELERRAQDAHARRAFGARLNADGDGWVLTDGDLDLECGELLRAVLDAELAVDPDNPDDTAAFEQLREQGWHSSDPLPETGQPGPRSLRQKRHDALKNALRRYLDSGIAGTRDKAAPHLDVIVGIDALERRPGALPAVSARSGARLPASLVRRWTADSSIARFVLGLGGKVIETSHRERTLKPHERRAKRIETGGWCQGSGCRSGPGTPMTPHHGHPWHRGGTTSLADTVNACRPTHHDLHSGKKRIRLRDGRWLDERGWAEGPPPA
jgi:hypothetical protein